MICHVEQRHLPYTPTQWFDLVADVERYPEFLPGFLASRVLRRDGNTVWVDMVIGSKFLNRRVDSWAVLDRPNRIDVMSEDDLFDRFEETWTFGPGETGGAIVGFSANIDFRPRPWRRLVSGIMEEGVRDMVTAFKHRARAIYGLPAPPAGP